MSTYSRSRLASALLGVGLMLVAGGGNPQSAGGVFEIRTHTLDSGGRSSGGIYSVNGVIGQQAASSSSGGVYSATSGMLRRRAILLPDVVFANGFE